MRYVQCVKLFPTKWQAPTVVARQPPQLQRRLSIIGNAPTYTSWKYTAAKDATMIIDTAAVYYCFAGLIRLDKSGEYNPTTTGNQGGGWGQDNKQDSWVQTKYQNLNTCQWGRVFVMYPQKYLRQFMFLILLIPKCNSYKWDRIILPPGANSSLA